jgi:solute carrier family 25 2-oxodicarboxylate transporter 21
MEVCVVQPFDMLKTRFQLSQGPSTSLLAAFRGVLAEGGVGRFYRGIAPELLSGIPKSSAMYAAYSRARTVIADARGGRDDWLTSFGAGAISGVPEALVVTPFQVVKIRLQAKEHLGRYTHSFDCVRKIVTTEGLSAFATGLGATVLRNSIWNAIYFSSYAAATAELARRRGPGDGEQSMRARMDSMSIGFGAGVFATCFNCPFDVVKSRIQSELVRQGARTTRGARPSLLSRIALIAKEEGVGALWKGLVAKSLRMGIGGAIGIFAFEISCDFLRR